jgi:excisionase family DNA binding protein
LTTQPATPNRSCSSDTTLNVAHSVYEWPFNSDVLTLVQAAALLHCHPKTLRIMAKSGRVPAKRVGSLWRFYRPALEAWLMDREAAA